MSAPGLVVFDWGGVIVRICRSWEEGCAAAGLPVRPGVEDPSLRARRRALAQDYQVGAIGCEAFAGAIAEATGGLYTPGEVLKIHDAWLLDEYAGVDRVIDDLHAAGVETGMLSNTNARHWRRQHDDVDGAPAFRVAARLRRRCASHLLRLAKPDAAIYDAFCREAGAAPRDILFFDDLEENIAAARAAGWRAHRIDHEADTAAQMRAALAEHGVHLPD